MIVVDTSALIAILARESEHAVFLKLLDSAGPVCFPPLLFSKQGSS